jgi:hypothetical protein
MKERALPLEKSCGSGVAAMWRRLTVCTKIPERAARRGSAEEQTGGGPKARTEGEREEEEGGRVREGKEARG